MIPIYSKTSNMRLTVFAIVGIVACITVAVFANFTPTPENIDISKLKPGDIVGEQSYPLKFGFRAVQRAEINHPGSFERVGHFCYFYFENVNLGGCESETFHISPDGKYALYLNDVDARLVVFKSESKRVFFLSSGFLGRPTHPTWDLKNNLVTVQLDNKEATTKESFKLP